jgi:hypothetical protein
LNVTKRQYSHTKTEQIKANNKDTARLTLNQIHFAQNKTHGVTDKTRQTREHKISTMGGVLNDYFLLTNDEKSTAEPTKKRAQKR